MLRRKACLWNAGQSWGWRWHSDVEGYSLLLRKACICHARKLETAGDIQALQVMLKVSNWLPREPPYKVTGWRWHSDVDGSFLLSRKACLWNARQLRGWRWRSSIIGYVEGQSVTGCQGNLCTKWQAVLRLKVTLDHCRLFWRSVSGCQRKNSVRSESVSGCQRKNSVWRDR